MEKEERRTSDATGWQVHGEEGVPQDLLIVRSMLQGLPKVCCPDGFGVRLQRRLAEADAGGSKARGAQRNWSLGWAGVGLGFATALVIAVVAFDLNVKQTPSGVAQGGAIIPAPVAVTTSVPASPSAQGKVTATVPETQQVSAPQLAQEQTSKQPGVAKDSTPQTPTSLPEGLYHVVGGNEK